jgi:hypothetical protein
MGTIGGGTAEAAAPAGPDRTPRPPRRAAAGKPRRDRRGPPQRQPRTGSYEKRAPKELVPITKEMEAGKAYLRSFGDLLQFHKKKAEHEGEEAQPNEQHDPAGDTNGTTT